MSNTLGQAARRWGGLNLLAIALWMSSSVGQAQDHRSAEPGRRDYETRLSSTQALYSALARESGTAGVDPVLEKARHRFSEAASRAAANDFASATRLLADSNAELKTTLIQIKGQPGAGTTPVGAAAGNQTSGQTGGQEQNRLRKELLTSMALLEALRREPKAPQADIESLEKDFKTSAEYINAGKTSEAAAVLDAAYARAKALLGQVKDSPKMASGSASADASRESTAALVDSVALRQKHTQLEDSVKSLQAAFARVTEEKGASQALLTETGKLQSEARRAADAGQYPTAIAALDRAYLLLKTALAELRGGSELTASKTFATPGQEFSYEQERNADYAQLIAGLIERAPDRTDWKATSARAGQLRDSALKAAGSGDFKDALGRMNESTVELKKILRAAGFPIL